METSSFSELPQAEAVGRGEVRACRNLPLLFTTTVPGPVRFFVLWMGVHTCLRAALFAKSAGDVDLSPLSVAGIFAAGLVYDLITASYGFLPLGLWLLGCPNKWLRHRWQRSTIGCYFFLVICFLLLSTAAEWLFWEEFGARFNFIAVDYLIYTTEVLGNIRESYPLHIIFGTVLAAALCIFSLLWTKGGLKEWMARQSITRSTFGGRMAVLSPFIAAPFLFTLTISQSDVPAFQNAFNQELAQNGIYSFFAAYRNNELPYERFYNTLAPEEALSRVRQGLTTAGSQDVPSELPDLTRSIVTLGEEKRWNVIQITVESLSAEYLGLYGNNQNLTPNLDRLARESLAFTNFYATGTRTVRGMEALTLSLPPTPGQSIVRRPGNENLFTLGSLFQHRGYDTAFIYGGYGYFDNMNYFFSNNGYRVVDRSSVAPPDISFANVWGACDEDVLTWSIAEADRAYGRHQPFFHFVMTTSNHRPYTYPEGKIDIPSHTGREGGVKYTDYAIGQFIERARNKPWFTNTLFVIVADHCASSAGRTDLPVKRYEIPLLIYNPELIAPAQVGTLCSQIDYPPTLLALMNWSYLSRFFGKDILKMEAKDERAFIASYQKLGFLTKDRLSILRPLREHQVYVCDRYSGKLTPVAGEDELVRENISYYQTASHVFRNGLHHEIDQP